MKYKVGDKVRIRSREAIKVLSEKEMVTVDPSIYEIAGTIRTIQDIFDEDFYLVNDYHLFISIHLIDDSEAMKAITDCANKIWENEALRQYEVPTGSIKIWDLPEGYIFKDENGNEILTSKIILEKKKKEYPKTLEVCCEVLDTGGYQIDYFVKPGEVYEYEKALITKISALYNLIICRDAYWQLYGEEMGLEKPWEPDWDAKDNHFYTIHTFNGKIECSATAHRNAVLIFPTKEMRDAFYENFKELIEQCKELL